MLPRESLRWSPTGYPTFAGIFHLRYLRRIFLAANGINAFIQATRRQNFLIPPRAHRAFPLLELMPPRYRTLRLHPGLRHQPS
jgi:hypothetical protein